ncbi:MAG: YlmC/YmxH family sporulation protein [Clostridia bacterium]|nr:YlmC/YmxH family sporulation protein [Clostridia bacterium]
MEFTFSDLRRKEVVNTQDGRKLGKACDVVLCYPENRWLGIVVPGENGFFRKRNELFIDLKQIVKIGEDVILVNVGMRREEKRGKGNACPPNYGGCAVPSGRERNYEEWE